MSQELLNQIDFRAFVMANNGKPVTTSLKVAEAFGKNHKDVLRAIQRIECSKEFNQRNFAPVDYLDAKGEKRPCYEMTKDGFVFLVMGFTGRQAAKFKEAYIEAFNWMYDLITQQGLTLSKRHNFLSLKYEHEKTDASLHGRYLSLWRCTKSNILNELENLEAQMQPMLDLFGLENKKADCTRQSKQSASSAQTTKQGTDL